MSKKSFLFIASILTTIFSVFFILKKFRSGFVLPGQIISKQSGKDLVDISIDGFRLTQLNQYNVNPWTLKASKAGLMKQKNIISCKNVSFDFTNSSNEWSVEIKAYSGIFDISKKRLEMVGKVKTNFKLF